MTIARAHLVDPSVTRWYHCVTRCVRRAFLFGEGMHDRKSWVEHRLEELAEIFSVAVAGFAILDNHLHLLVRLDPDVAQGWSDEDVVRRWRRLFPPRDQARQVGQFRGHHTYFFGVRCGVPETTRLAWVRRGKYRGVVLCGPFLADELDDRRNQLGRHDHDGLALGEKSRFVLRDLFVFGLIVEVLGKLANSLFIPSRGIRLCSSLGHFIFLRWRLRNARFALGVRSKAVTTNALSPTLSGT